jgi:hypothetical protein
MEKYELSDLGPFRFSEAGILSKKTCTYGKEAVVVAKKEEAKCMVEGRDQGESEDGRLGGSLL